MSRFQNDVGTYDHVMLGTGYHIDISKLGLLRSGPCFARFVRSTVRHVFAPALNPVCRACTSGANAVKSHGPLMRFIAGVQATQRR